jgi:hypothetical protein
VTAIPVNTAGVTVNVVEPLIVPIAAVSVVLPIAWLDATPAADIVATFVAEEAHVTAAVRSWVLASV